MTFRDELDEVLADARLLLDAELSVRRPPPDVRDVMQRAREMRVGAEEQLALEAEELATISDLEPELERAFEPDPELAELNGDARLLLDGLLERRPAMQRTRWRQRPRMSAVAAAAVVLLGLATAAFASKRALELEAAAESDRFAAAAIAELDQAWLAECERAQASARVASSWVIPVVPIIASPDPGLTALPAPIAVAETDGSSSPGELAPKLSTAQRLELLDAEAYALLRAGKHQEASRRFRVIVEIGGRSEYAELAFGELFALARREGGDGLDKLWPAYLQRFPSGRYADAARAGLCRRTPEQSQRACWTDYLLEHPRGAARSEALRETQDE